MKEILDLEDMNLKPISRESHGPNLEQFEYQIHVRIDYNPFNKYKSCVYIDKNKSKERGRSSLMQTDSQNQWN